MKKLILYIAMSLDGFIAGVIFDQWDFKLISFKKR
jgi:hypothetical protein